jgi:outer membrane protein OmpA-like peptidoglycan-associated protein
MMTRKGAHILALGLMAAACAPSSQRNEAEIAPATDNAAPSDAAEDAANETVANEADAPKSILRPEIAAPEPPAPVIKPIELVVPFGTSGMKLDDEGRRLLDTMVTEPAVAAGGPIMVSGHTDTRGSDGDNFAASRVRAEVVRAYLVSKGIAADRMTVVALGERRAIAPNAHPDGSDDPEGRAKNRRVEVKVDLPPAPSTEAGIAPPAQDPESKAARPAGAPQQ